MFRPLLLALSLSSALSGGHALAAEPPVPHSPGAPYAAGVLADRIVLNPGADAARQMAVTFRTGLGQAQTQLQLARALPGPSLGQDARTLPGVSQRLDSDNGPAYFHQVRLDGLEPDTAYVYRVKAEAGWSEWLQFRTAKAAFAPFSFIYLGDTQNDILAIASRSIRQALRSLANPALVLHAGDLTSQRDDMLHDDEWGEWNQAGGYFYAGVPQLVAAGNHEYLDAWLPDGRETRKMGPHFPLQFTLPQNGAQGVEHSSYFVDYQGVRFIVLDGTSALDLGTLDAQSAWLERTLKSSKARWNLVLMHQPVFTCARPEQDLPLQQRWQPLFERYHVDLVMQGHDHCYTRISDPAGREASARARQADAPQGPVYLVSVTGSKMYGLQPSAYTQPDRSAEDTQLYQTVTVDAERLQVRAYSADGALYDAFDLERAADGRNRLRTPIADLPAERRCEAGQGPDGLRCTARDKD